VEIDKEKGRRQKLILHNSKKPYKTKKVSFFDLEQLDLLLIDDELMFLDESHQSSMFSSSGYLAVYKKPISKDVKSIREEIVVCVTSDFDVLIEEIQDDRK